MSKLHLIHGKKLYISIFIITYLSLSTVVLNSRDRPENIWLLKGMHLDTQWYKIQSAKNLPQRYKYSSHNAISLFEQAKC